MKYTGHSVKVSVSYLQEFERILVRSQSAHTEAVNKIAGHSMYQTFTNNTTPTELLSTKDIKGLVNRAEWGRYLFGSSFTHATGVQRRSKRRLIWMRKTGHESTIPVPRNTRTRVTRYFTRAHCTKSKGAKSPYDDSTTVDHYRNTWNITKLNRNMSIAWAFEVRGEDPLMLAIGWGTNIITSVTGKGGFWLVESSITTSTFSSQQKLCAEVTLTLN